MNDLEELLAKEAIKSQLRKAQQPSLGDLMELHLCKSAAQEFAEQFSEEIERSS